MIEPLRFNEEHCPVYSMERPVFCEICRFSRAKKNNPNVADKFCPTCVQKQFLCSECDHQAHRVGPLRLHMRRIIVLGHGVRKVTKVRGDGVNFPLPMDKVEVILVSKIYHDGKEINREPPRRYQFMTGLSGLTMHVQVLGAKNLVSADLSGTSDPFVKATYAGRMLGTTRVRPRALNPRWENETFLVPMDPRLPESRKVSNAQKDMFRLEVYDYDWLGVNDMLGIVEISRSRLRSLASVAGSTPIVLPLTLSEFHGVVGIELGLCSRYVHIKIVRGEALDSADVFGASDPYAKVLMCGRLMGKTPVVQDTNDPVWKEGNVFHVKINDVLREERKLLLQKRQRELLDTTAMGGMLAAAVGTKRDDVGIDIDERAKDTGDDSIWSIELFDDNKFTRHVSLGVAKVDVAALRIMLPQLPRTFVTELPPVGSSQKAQAAKALSMAKQAAPSRGLSSRLQIASMRGAALAADDSSDSSLASDVDLADLYDSAGPRFEEYDPVLSLLGKMSDDRTSDGDTSEKASRRNRFSRSGSSASPQGSPAQTPLNLSPLQSPFQTHLNSPVGSRMGSPSATPRLTLTSSNLEKLGNKSLQERVSTMYSDYLDENQLDKKIGHLQSTIAAIQERGDPEPEGSGRGRAVSFEDGADQEQASAGASVGSSPGAINSKDVDEIVLSLKAELAELQARRAAQVPRLMPIAEEQSFVERTVSIPATKKPDVGDSEEIEEEDEEDGGGALLDLKTKPSLSLGTLRQGSAMLARGMSSSALLKGVSSGAILGLGSEEKELEPVDWSRVRHYKVERQNADNIARPEVKDRGFLLVRLINATRGNVIAGLDEGVRAMTVGETAQLKVRFDYAYGHYCMGGNVPPRANIIFEVKLLRLNGYGRLGMPLRQARRFLRLFIRVFKGAKKVINGCRRHMQQHKPIKRCFRRLFGSTAALDDKGSFVEGGMSVEGVEEDVEEDEESDEEDPLAAAQATLEVKIDPAMKRLVNPSVKAGSKYLFGWQPEKRIVRAARPRRAPRVKGGDGEYDELESQEDTLLAESQQDTRTRAESAEEAYYDPYDPNAPHERRGAILQQAQEEPGPSHEGVGHREAFVGHAPPVAGKEE